VRALLIGAGTMIIKNFQFQLLARLFILKQVGEDTDCAKKQLMRYNCMFFQRWWKAEVLMCLTHQKRCTGTAFKTPHAAAVVK